MNLLIYGHKGWIGTQFIELLKNGIEKENYTLSLSRVDDTPNLLKELDEIKPTHVIKKYSIYFI